MDIAKLAERGLACRQAGDFAGAGTAYRALLDQVPDHLETLFALATLLIDRGEAAEGAALLARAAAQAPNHPPIRLWQARAALALNAPEQAAGFAAHALALSPQDPEIRFHLALADQLCGRLNQAAARYAALLTQHPAFAEAAHNLGLLREAEGRGGEALAAYDQALAARPDYPDASLNRARLLRAGGDPEAAIATYLDLLDRHPGFAIGWANLGNAHTDLERFDDAETAYARALTLAPATLSALIGQGAARARTGAKTAALDCFDHALALAPPDAPELAQAHLQRGMVLIDLERRDEARAAFAAALARDPALDLARFGAVIAELPVIAASQAALGDARRRYAAALDGLARHYDAQPTAVRVRAAGAAGMLLPFNLAYQGADDRDLQCRHGALLHGLMADAFPDWMTPPPVAAPALSERIRIGIVSAFFSQHSNWKIPIKGWVENLDPARFALYGYHSAVRQDAETAIARRSFTRFVQAPIGFAALAETIRTDRLHVLIYPEIGMDPVSARLAALRLAPVQGSSWGHPMTSGYPSLDFFLSSDLMEPPDAQAHYSERLVRLPNLSIHYQPPAIAPDPDGLAALLPDLAAEMAADGQAVFCLCTQSLSKYLPEDDWLFATIAAAAPAARFLFLARPTAAGAVLFQQRLGAAFAAAGLDAALHVRMLPVMVPAHFAALQQRADLFLDSLAWSGCNTTLEALAAGLPVVTLPGRFMRGRHSAAILTMMGLGDLIAASPGDYVARAAALIAQPARRGAERGRIQAAWPRLLADSAPVTALAAFLVACAERGQVPEPDAVLPG